MALCGRAVFQIARRGISCTSVRRANEIDPFDQITGLQRRELLAEAAGIDDPYNLRAIKRDRLTTKETPFEVPSVNLSRVIGCVCQQDATSVNWLWLEGCEPQRCQCGHWFKLVKAVPL